MEENKLSIKIPMTQVLNLSEYKNYRNLLECYLCKNLAITPSYCENCKNSFCSTCLSELNLPDNKCPNCMLENIELNISNDKFYDFFKDLTIQCYICDEKVKYPEIKNHKCFKFHVNANVNKPKKEGEEYKIIDNIIHFRCPRCKEFIQFNQKESHMISCPANQIMGGGLNIPSNLINPNISSLSEQIPCKFCFKNIYKSDEINHLTECPEFVKKISISGKFEFQNKPVNILEILDSFNKFSQNLDNANLQKLISTIGNFEKTLINFTSITEASYCFSCKSVKKNYDLVLCKCCNKKYCVNCCVPCTNCNNILSKNCLFTCQNCKLLKCPLCEMPNGNFCMCLENKFCRTCFENPNINNISIALLKGPHVSCSFVKLLENNIYVVKVPQFNFKAEISFNSIKQAISISLIKNRIELFSRIFQINVNDKLIIVCEDAQFKIGSSMDYWGLDMKSIEGSFDFLIINFNVNPNYSYTLNKLNNSVFEQLSPANAIVGGMYDMFSGRKQLINNIIFQKL